MKKSVETILYSTIGVVAMAIILIAANLIFSYVKIRIDLTAEKLYTLSPSTKKILSKLDPNGGNIKVRFYCTQHDITMPVSLKAYAKRVEDLLAEYRQESRGLIEVERLDPQPDSDAEDSANLDGIEGQMISLTDKIYLGLSVSYLDAKESIPFLSPERERLIEYDITRALTRVLNPEKPSVGIMSSLPVMGAPSNPFAPTRGPETWVFINELKRDFNVKSIALDVDQIDHDIKVLVVLYPKGVTDKTQYALDQFVLRGGKLIAFLDPLSFVDSQNSPNQFMQSASENGATLDKLLKAWGIEFDTSKVVSDPHFLTRLSRGGRPENSSTVLSLTHPAINTEEIVTGQLDTFLLGYSGAFTGTPAEGLKLSSLLKTSNQARLMDRFMAQYGGEEARHNDSSAPKEYPLAIRLSGKFKTAFPGGKPVGEGNSGSSDSSSPLKESSEENSVILVADSDMLYDMFSVQVQAFFGQKIINPINGNLSFIQNAVELFAGDSNLVGLRSRAAPQRPFIVFKKIEHEAEERYRVEIKQHEESLANIQRRLSELQNKKEQGQRFIISPEQQAELEKFRQQQGETKKKLKQVRKNLRRDIDSLQTQLKLANILGMPLLTIVFGTSLAIYQHNRTRKR